MRRNNYIYFPDNIIADALKKPTNVREIERHYFMQHVDDFQRAVFLLRGITNYKYCHHINRANADYFYFDTGYFGNMNSYYEPPTYKKAFHRMVYNNLQLNELEKVDDSRYQIILKYIRKDFKVKEKDLIKPWKKNGSKILICPPSEKVSHTFGIKTDPWIEEVTSEIKKYSDREIIVRKKTETRMNRVTNPIQKVLDDDIFILVTYNSIAATEAIIHGIPALTLGVNAATSVSINKIKKIENPVYPDRQLWLNNLAYGQFHIEEFQNGVVWDHIEKIANQ